MTYYVNQTFFRPEEMTRIPWVLPASLYNLTRLAIRDSEKNTSFISLRAMQFVAVIDEEEVVFVDGNGEYEVRDGEGGRIIKLAWQNFNIHERASIDDPVPIEVVYYSHDAEQHFKRIIGLLGPAIEEHRSVKNPPPAAGAKIIRI